MDGQLLPSNFLNASEKNPACNATVRMQEVSTIMLFYFADRKQVEFIFSHFFPLLQFFHQLISETNGAK